MRYSMRQKLANSLGSVGERYVFEDDAGQVRYRTGVKPSVLHLAVGMQDATGRTVVTVRMLSMSRPATHFEIVRGEERTAVRQTFNGGHQHFTATAPGGECIEAAGDWQAKTFTFLRGGQQIGRMVGEWYSITERYDIEVAADEDDELVLALALVIHLVNQPTK